MPIIDVLVYAFVRFALGGLNLLPLRWRVKVMRSFFATMLRWNPRHLRVIHRNLELAFPELSDAERAALAEEHFEALAWLVVDFARLHTLDEAWVRRHVECPFLPRFLELKAAHPESGLVIVTGHLGSFELLAQAVPYLCHPISFVVRRFELPLVDRWWTSVREANGNKVIGRKGAFQEIPRHLKAGRDVALLFDQNVKRSHAVFVPFFGRLAATTKTPAICALRAQVPVVVASVSRIGEDRYRINAVECDFEKLYRDEQLSFAEKIEHITARLSEEFERMVRADPAGWFWLHRRWKTRPEGEAENLYEKE